MKMAVLAQSGLVSTAWTSCPMYLSHAVMEYRLWHDAATPPSAVPPAVTIDRAGRVPAVASVKNSELSTRFACWLVSRQSASDGQIDHAHPPLRFDPPPPASLGAAEP